MPIKVTKKYLLSASFVFAEYTNIFKISLNCWGSDYPNEKPF